MSEAPKAPPADATPARSASIDQVESELVRLVNAKDAKGIFAMYDAGMKEFLPEEKTRLLFEKVEKQVGRVVASKRLPDSDATSGADTKNEAHYRWSAERGGALKVDLHVDAQGKITGILIGPSLDPADEPPVRKSDIPLGLPFRGQWSVFWGGDRPDVNAHFGYRAQRRAADLEVAGPERAVHRGDGKKNEDYYAYGQEVLAVADGTVTTLVDGIPDNMPGTMNRTSLPGNVVILQHTDALFSVYAHLQPAKFRVKLGAKVTRGAVLGLCGNSGNSDGPHLHLHLQDGPIMEKSWGVEAVFQDVPVVRQGKSVRIAEYTFLRGDLIGEPPAK